MAIRTKLWIFHNQKKRYLIFKAFRYDLHKFNTETIFKEKTVDITFISFPRILLQVKHILQSNSFRVPRIYLQLFDDPCTFLKLRWMMWWFDFSCNFSVVNNFSVASAECSPLVSIYIFFEERLTIFQVKSLSEINCNCSVFLTEAQNDSISREMAKSRPWLIMSKLFLFMYYFVIHTAKSTASVALKWISFV